MNRHICIAAGLAVLAVAATRKAQAQLNVLDQTRSITVTANGTVEPGDSDTNTLGGAYSNNLGNSLTVTNPPLPNGSCYNGGSQTSLVSSSVLSDNASAGGGGDTIPPDSYTTPEITADSYYSVDFTVSSPTPFDLTGAVSTAFGSYQEGPQPIVAATILMTETQGANQTQILNEGFPKEPLGGDFQLGGSGSLPLSAFNTILEPGYTYNLTSDVNADIRVDSITETTTGSVGINFTAAVPEPGTITGLLAASGLLFVRRRSR